MKSLELNSEEIRKMRHLNHKLKIQKRKNDSMKFQEFLIVFIDVKSFF